MARTVGSAADDTRARILDVAVDLFIEKGYAGTSVRDISERLGMTKGSLYYHFASKDDVLAALVEPLLADLDAFAAGRAADLDPRGRIEYLVDLLDRHGAMLRSLMGDPSVLHKIAAREAMGERIGAIQRVLGGGDVMRGRLTLGVINAGAVAPRWETMAEGGRAGLIGARLTPAEREQVVSAALAVQAVI